MTSRDLVMGTSNSSLCRTNAHSQTRGANSPATNNLPPLVFHPVHGENIRLSRNSAIARRTESFCKGITFSNRPVRINERVYIRFVETSISWSGSLRFGFTTADPSHFRSCLPKYACPDLTSKPGNWAKALGERHAQTGTVLYYYVTEYGEVHFGLNGEEKGVFFSGVSTTAPLWALIDVYGNTVGVEFLDPKKPQNNSPNFSTSSLERQLSEIRNLNLGLVNEDLLPLKTYQGTQFSPLPFHRTRGCNVFLSADRCIAERSDSDYCQGYVFTSRPLQSGEKMVIQVLQTESMYAGALSFGLTSCNPANLLSTDFPDDADGLLDRPEYWVVMKDIASSPNKGDELAFSLTTAGEVQFSKNGQTPTTVVHVDNSLPLWAFFDLYGNTVRVRILGTVKEAPVRHHYCRPIPPIPPQSNRNSPPSVSGLTVSLPPSSKAKPKSPEKSQNTGSSNWLVDECAVCYDENVDSVMYPCGHMCMCYKCAFEQWKGDGSGLCPICRALIRDVIRIYRS